MYKLFLLQTKPNVTQQTKAKVIYFNTVHVARYSNKCYQATQCFMAIILQL